MFKLKKKHTVTFKRRKLLHIIYAYSLIVLFFITIYVIDHYVFTRSSYEINTIFYLIPIIAFASFTFYLFYTSRYSFSKIQQIKAKLRHVILFNKLYVTDKDTNPYKAVTSMKFKFYFQDHSLIIESYPNGAPYTLQSVSLAKKLESALSMNLTDIKHRSPHFVTYEFSVNKPDRIIVDKALLNDFDPLTIPLDSEKDWKFTNVPHGLIAGATGSGKTFMIYYLILQFAIRGADIFILDPKRSDLSSLKSSIPNASNRIASTPATMAKILREANDEMNKRYDTMFNKTDVELGKNYIHYNLKPIVIVFDEVAAAMEEDKKIAKEIDSYLKQLILKGRQAGIFMILSTQKPNAEAVSTVIRDQIGLRIALGQLSKSGYRMTLGDEWDELPSAETETGKGFVFLDGEGWTLPRPFEAPYLDFEGLNYRQELYSAMMNNR
ncbi:helicase HerA-like domain-containing protein [Virgibacillus sp. 179-BFC.A HS]|uniref:Helicase HerA-like domain-containing protein n=1 Tax=Tigheibacillus jepli TaxID=3035914 RepID=A0ABU5CJU5_9BACI|nr:helicase HerA-like domain-containing protein [Virgibacillus sp. 179-BFC.A HS]MDY0406505.1 helicase HerA-like domain-containing protein [Virgibacillus sp. 179-BFC.A HS]